MFDIPEPEGDFFLRYENACKLKQKDEFRIALEMLKPTIQARYDEYDRNKKNPELVPKIARTKPEIDALESCYSPTLKLELLDDLKQRIAERVGPSADARKRIRCPYCQIEPATRWDHFLPVSHFPDFAMYSPNLLYICEVCNNEIKKAGLYTHPRSTINPYFDDLTHAYLTCELVIDRRIDVIFRITTPAGASSYVKEIMERHFREYKLENKFLAEAGNIEDQVFYAYYFARGKGIISSENLSEYITGRVTDMNKRKVNPNHWEHALLTAYLQNTDGLVPYFESRYISRMAPTGYVKSDSLL